MASNSTSTDLILRTSISEPDNAHSFFGSFAREIRDEIYDLIFQEKERTVTVRSTHLESYNPQDPHDSTESEAHKPAIQARIRRTR
jgi:hypothetical protein